MNIKFRIDDNEPYPNTNANVDNSQRHAGRLIELLSSQKLLSSFHLNVVEVEKDDDTDNRIDVSLQKRKNVGILEFGI